MRLNPGIESAGNRAGGILRSAVEQSEGARVGLIRRAAWISTATASLGSRSASGHLASFDRRKCKGPLNGPTATGQHCPEGWTLYPTPGTEVQERDRVRQRRLALLRSGSINSTRLGLGKNTPIVTGNASDSLLALVNGKFVVMRVPYPLGFFAKGMDGRIDDAKAGWKGKGVWTTWGTRTPFHSETGKGTTRQGGSLPASPRPAGELACPPPWLKMRRCRSVNNLFVPIALAAVPNMLAVLAGILINNSRLSDFSARLSDTNARLNEVDARLGGAIQESRDHMDTRFNEIRDLWRSELYRVEQVFDARLRAP